MQAVTLSPSRASAKLAQRMAIAAALGLSAFFAPAIASASETDAPKEAPRVQQDTAKNQAYSDAATREVLTAKKWAAGTYTVLFSTVNVSGLVLLLRAETVNSTPIAPNNGTRNPTRPTAYAGSLFSYGVVAASMPAAIIYGAGTAADRHPIGKAKWLRRSTIAWSGTALGSSVLAGTFLGLSLSQGNLSNGLPYNVNVGARQQDLFTAGMVFSGIATVAVGSAIGFGIANASHARGTKKKTRISWTPGGVIGFQF